MEIANRSETPCDEWLTCYALLYRHRFEQAEPQVPQITKSQENIGFITGHEGPWGLPGSIRLPCAIWYESGRSLFQAVLEVGNLKQPPEMQLSPALPACSDDTLTTARQKSMGLQTQTFERPNTVCFSAPTAWPSE